MAKTKKTKEITANVIEKAMQITKHNVEIITIGTEENSLEIPVKKYITLTERSNMINDIASMVFTIDANGNQVYAPYFRKFAIDFNIVNYFTDIKLPVKSDEVSLFFDRTNIAEFIAKKVSESYIRGIVREADELIEYKKNSLAKASKSDDILANVNDVIALIKNKTENMDASDLTKIVSEHAPELKERLEAMLNGGAVMASVAQ